jgi:hypothetical protein
MLENTCLTRILNPYSTMVIRVNFNITTEHKFGLNIFILIIYTTPFNNSLGQLLA